VGKILNRQNSHREEKACKLIGGMYKLLITDHETFFFFKSGIRCLFESILRVFCLAQEIRIAAQFDLCDSILIVFSSV